MLIPATSTSTAEPGALGTGLQFGHSRPEYGVVTGLAPGWDAALNQHLFRGSCVALAGGDGDLQPWRS